MQMHDALGIVSARSSIDQLAGAFAIAPAQADAVTRALVPEFAWQLETMALSRGGLADVVELLGSDHRTAQLASGRNFGGEAAAGKDILARVLGTRAASRTLAARAARRCGVDADTIAAMLPHLALVVIGAVAQRANPGLAAVLAQVPPLGRLSRGSPHADLAGILRRRCGAGCHSPRALPRAVRRALPGRGIVVWYLSFMAGRTAARLLRSLVPAVAQSPMLRRSVSP